MTNVKIYGADEGRFGSTRDGVERFWRNVFAGHASARFHRPPSGAGLSEVAQRMIRSAREVTNALDIFSCEPRPDLLSERGENAAYCLASPGREYAVYFTDGGRVRLDAPGAQGLKPRWYAVEESRFLEEEADADDGEVELACPGEGQWAAVLSPGPRGP